MGLLDQFSEFAKTPEGQGLLSAAFGGLAGARRGQPLNSIGRAGLAGLQGYGGALDRQSQEAEAAFQKQFRTSQMEDLQRKRAKDQAQEQWRTQLPGLLAPKLQGDTEQSRMLADQMGPDATPDDVNAMNSNARMPQAGFTFAPDKQALDRHLMDANSPFADKLLEQRMFPKAEDYRVVGGDLVRIGSGGVTVAHQSQRPDNIPAEQKLYNLAKQEGYKGTFLDFLGAKVSNAEGAKASFDVMPVTRPDGTTTLLPRSTVAAQSGGGAVRPTGNFTGSGYQGGSAGSAATEQRAIMQRERQTAEAAGNTELVAALDREMGRLPGGQGMPVQSKAQEAAAVATAKAQAEFEDPIAVAKRTKKNEGTIAAAKNVVDAITDAKSMVGWSTTGMGSALAGVPGSKAKDLSTKLETIKANLGFDRLQEMRDQSPTGGALGAIAVQELTALQSTVSSLDQAQSPEQLRQSLDKIQFHYDRWMKTLEGSGGASGTFDKPTRKVVKTGIYNGKKVIQYDDGSTEYAN